MPIPIIPILALLGIVGGVSALAWYMEQSRENQMKADRLAMKWFGQAFRQLSEYQQEQIRKNIS